MSDKTKTVLIIDDEEAVAQSYRIHLNDKYEVKTATSGQEAISKIDADVDVIVIDRRMPGLTGDDVIERLSMQELGIKVIIASGIDPDTDIIGLPIDGYLTKTVTKQELIDAVDRVLLKDELEELLAEYDKLSETYEILNSEYMQTELMEKDEFGDLEEELATLESEINSIADEIDGKGIASILQ
jgi:DNA-binding NtrC family response regulator